MKETRVEAHLVKRVRETGGFIRKLVYPGRRGAPDRLCGWPKHNRFAMPELKRPLTPTAEDHQKREHAVLNSVGIETPILASIEEVDAFVEHMTQ